VFVADKNPHKTPYFAVFYVFMHWMKASCRPIIGLDGCLLKHCCKRQRLCAIRRDGNNQIFLGVPGIVKIGSKGTWTLMRLERELSRAYKTGFGGLNGPNNTWNKNTLIFKSVWYLYRWLREWVVFSRLKCFLNIV